MHVHAPLQDMRLRKFSKKFPTFDTLDVSTLPYIANNMMVKDVFLNLYVFK